MIGTRRLKSPASTRSWQTDRWFITTDEWNGAACRNGKNLHWRAAQRNIVTRQSLLRYGFVTVYTATFSCQCRIAVVLLYFALWLVKKTRDTLSTNQMQNQKQSRLSHPRFPALWAVCLFSLWVLIGSLKHFPSLWLAVVITLVFDVQSRCVVNCDVPLYYFTWPTDRIVFCSNCTDHNSFSVFYLVQFFADWKAKTELKQAEKEKAEVILHWNPTFSAALFSPSDCSIYTSGDSGEKINILLILFSQSVFLSYGCSFSPFISHNVHFAPRTWLVKYV